MTRSLLALLLLSTGCDQLSQVTPTVQFSRLDVQDIDFDHIDADFVFAVQNPNPVGVRLDRFSYDLALEATDLLSGEEPEGLNLPALASAEVSLPASLIWQDVWDTVQAVRGEDEVDFDLGGSFGFDTRWGPLDLPYQTDGRFPALRTPRFRLGTLRVQGIDVLQGQATVVLDVAVDNAHGSALDLLDLDYTVSLAGREVAEGIVERLGTIDGATEQVVGIPLTINLVRAGASVISVLTSGGRLDAGIDATVDVDTPFGLLPLSLDETGDVEVRR